MCTIDQPILGQAVEFNPLPVGEYLYIRLHGRNETAWKKSLSNFNKKQTYEQQNERYSYLYSFGELMDIDHRIKDMYDSVKGIYIILNNHPKGDAVPNAFELMYILKKRSKLVVPETTLKAYPRLSRVI